MCNDFQDGSYTSVLLPSTNFLFGFEKHNLPSFKLQGCALQGPPNPHV